MTATGQLYAGSRLTAAGARGSAPLSAYKASDQAGSGSTLADDDDLLISLQANAVYSFELVIGYTGSARGSGDIKVGWSLPSGSTIAYAVYGMSTSSAVATAAPWATSTSAQALGSNGSTAVGAVLTGTVTTGSTAGTMQLQWARNSGSSTAPTVLSGSSLAAWQVQ